MPSPSPSCPPRRAFRLAGLAALIICALPMPTATATEVNLAMAATPSSAYCSGDTTLAALNDGITPANSGDASHRSYGNWPRTDVQWVQYEWSQPIATNRMDVFWWIDGRGVGAPKSCRLLYWDGAAFVPVKDARGLGVAGNVFNSTTFTELRTSKLRLEISSDGRLSTGILEWKVYDSGKSPDFPPSVSAGLDRVVLTGGKTWLSGSVRAIDGKPAAVAWTKESGPGEVRFDQADAVETHAGFTAPGDYVVKLTAGKAGASAAATVRVRAVAPPPAERLDVVYTKPYSLDSPLWNARAKALIVQWIPHCIRMIERTDLPEGQGGIDNFTEAAKAIRGEPHARHKGYVFSNAWVHQTVEAMCLALMVDARGDKEILAAQQLMRATLENWIPVILAAQEPDGYLHTAYTLADRKAWPERWSPSHRGDHEGYVAGYFIESAINHYTLTDGKDRRLYDAAKKLADCWVAHIGPGKKDWYDGHQEMEQALVRFGRFVNDMEGGGRGDAYITLARFLLDARKGGEEYDQSHQLPIHQFAAVGHAVRATYHYSAMADIAAETHDPDYMGAVMSLWDNMVNRKYYLTGGIGSGETSEGFGPDYSLRHEAYCEACSSAGLIFFQYKLNLAYHDARYADLYEETFYNALLGSIDLAGRNFYYDNPLVEHKARYPWHVCPCCVGNIPRTLLMIPTWTYVKSRDGLFVNLFIGSRIQVGEVAGTPVEMIQRTNYPWDGAVAITVNPRESRSFAIHVRVPNRTTSQLYTPAPAVNGISALAVNGKHVAAAIKDGYAVITREWKAGDVITMEIPLVPQRIKADPKIAATRGMVALRRGPMVYNVELADQPDISRALGTAPITAAWRPDLLGGVTTLTGTWEDGTPMLAIPNFARMNRTGQITEARATGDPAVNYAPGSNTPANTPAPKPSAHAAGPASAVWMKDMP